MCLYFLYEHTQYEYEHSFDMLLCPHLRLKTASSLSWGGSPTSFLPSNTCFILAPLASNYTTVPIGSPLLSIEDGWRGACLL